jgi:hypothetical protein
MLREKFWKIETAPDITILNRAALRRWLVGWQQ